MSKKQNKVFFKELTKFFIIIISIAILFSGVIFGFCYFQYNVNGFSVLKNISEINNFDETNLSLDNEFSNNDLQTAKLKLNNPTFNNNCLRLTDKEIAALINEEYLEFDYSAELKQLTFSNYEASNILTRLEFIINFNISDFKTNQLNAFPANIITMNIDDNFYLTINVDIDENLNFLYKSIILNNLSISETTNLFKFFNIFSEELNYEKISISLANSIFSAIVGTDTKIGIFNTLKEVGAKKYKFEEYNGHNCFAIYNSTSTPAPSPEETYQIIYKNTKGSENLNPKTYSPSDSTISLLDLSAVGYNFVGWKDENNSSITTIDPILSKNITLYAEWEVITYLIIYDLKNGTLTESNPNTYTIETETFTLNNPTKENYTFLGWTSEIFPKITTTATIPKGSYGNIKFTAVFLKNVDGVSTFSISYKNTKNAINPNPVTFAVNSNIIHLEDLSATGYEFLGWYDKNNLKTTTIQTDAAENITLTAKWQTINYSINYNLDGGSISGINPTTYTIETDDFELINPTKSGFKFFGWTGTNLNNLTETVIIKKGSYGDLSFTANYGELPRKNIYYSNQKSAINNNITSFREFDGIITLSDLSLPGYNFLGWFNSSDKQVTYIDSSDFRNYYLTAKWHPINYSITYYLNGGSVPSANPNTYTIETDDFELINPTKANYEFLGWTGTDLNNLTETVIIKKGSYGDLCFTANYKKLNNNFVTVSLCVDGNVLLNHTVASGSIISESEINNLYQNESVGMVGYLVDDWYSNATLTTSHNFSTVITTDITLYGKSEYIVDSFINKSNINKFKTALNNLTITVNNRKELINWLFFVRFYELTSSTQVKIYLTYIANNSSSILDELDSANNDLTNLNNFNNTLSIKMLASSTYGIAYITNSISNSIATNTLNSTGYLYEEIEYFPIKTFDDLRTDSFSDFNINKVSNELEVTNSIQLLQALEMGFKPKFTTNSPAEKLYNSAKSVLRDICNDQMSNIEKVYAIYTWLAQNVQYDYYAAHLLETGQLSDTQSRYYDSWFAEGVFNNKKAVCEGIAKAFLLMAKLENIPAIYVTGNNHAWNKVYLDGAWYGIDATHANLGYPTESIEFISYSNFLFTDSFKKSLGYSTTNHANISATTTFNFYDYLDFSINNSSFDLKIDSLTELDLLYDYIISQSTISTGDFYSIEIILPPSITINTAYNRGLNQGINFNNSYLYQNYFNSQTIYILIIEAS